MRSTREVKGDREVPTARHVGGRLHWNSDRLATGWRQILPYMVAGIVMGILRVTALVVAVIIMVIAMAQLLIGLRWRCW